MCQLVRPLTEIQPDYNFLMGYYTGIPKEWYRGIENITFIWMGSWNDPLLGYKGYAVNEPYVTDGLYEIYHEETGEDDPDEGFTSWLQENRDLLYESLDEIIQSYKKEMPKAS